MHKWTIIGAGPAGILALGHLLDNNIKPEEILWLDPKFNVGDLGGKWYNVTSNTSIKTFLDAAGSCKSFNFP